MLQLDAMSRATFISRAVINAVRNAIAEAKLNVNNYISSPVQQKKAEGYLQC